MVTRMKGILTDFGPLSFALKVAPDGKKADLNLDVPSRVRPSRVVLHLDGWSWPFRHPRFARQRPCQPRDRTGRVITEDIRL